MQCRLLCVCALTLSVLACGGSGSPQNATKVPTSGSTGIDDSEPIVGGDAPIPSRCVIRKGACMPPVNWAQRLCESGVYQDVALYMFRSGTPWTRFYMRTGLNAVNGWGPTVAEDLVAGEEVIPINYRSQSTSFYVEGSEGTFDVLRWNGSCVTLDVTEVTSDRPHRPRHSRVDWRSLSNEMQQALLENPEIEDLYDERRKECKGASIGRVTKRCEDLDRELVNAIPSYVRTIEQLPEPKEHP